METGLLYDYFRNFPMRGGKYYFCVEGWDQMGVGSDGGRGRPDGRRGQMRAGSGGPLSGTRSPYILHFRQSYPYIDQSPKWNSLLFDIYFIFHINYYVGPVHRNNDLFKMESPDWSHAKC